MIALAKPQTFLNTITTGDARELAKLIPDNSIDLIFTDPPYPKEYLYLYEWLAEDANRVLKPGGFCLVYCGQYHLDKVMTMMTSHLTYYWMIANVHPGSSAVVFSRMACNLFKPILIFCKGVPAKHRTFNDAWWGNRDKRFHIWGQGTSTASYYIDCFSVPGEIVWEPFTGGGTTLEVCKQISRQFIAFEIDTTTADIARKRLETVQPLLISDEAEQLSWEVRP